MSSLSRFARSLGYTLGFPEQQHKLSPGSAIDPDTEKSVSIETLDDQDGRLVITRGSKRQGEPFPEALIPKGPISDGEAARSNRPGSAKSVPRRNPEVPGTRFATRESTSAHQRTRARRFDPDQRTRRATRTHLFAGPQLPVYPGTARLGQDLERQPPDHAPDRSGSARGCCRDEPQGDPQPPRMDRTRCRRGGRGVSRLEEVIGL